MRFSGASADLYIVPELFKFTEETLHFDRPIEFQPSMSRAPQQMPEKLGFEFDQLYAFAFGN